MAQNLITVFIPCYNAEEYIEDCIASILSQTHQAFEVLIIDDGSTDQSVQRISAIKDDRIRLVRNEKNLGIVGVLNLGFELVNTKYLVRQDADDKSVENRLEKLVAFMEANADVDVCGSALSLTPTNKIIRHPEKHDEISARLLQYTSITHGASIFRMESINHHKCRYEPDFAYAEDFRFFTQYWRILKYANLPDELYWYRVHDEQISRAKSDIQISVHNKALSSYVEDVFGVQMDSARANVYFRPVTSNIVNGNFNHFIGLYSQIIDDASLEVKNILRSNLKRVIRHSKLSIWYRGKALYWYFFGLNS